MDINYFRSFSFEYGEVCARKKKKNNNNIVLVYYTHLKLVSRKIKKKIVRLIHKKLRYIFLKNKKNLTSNKSQLLILQSSIFLFIDLFICLLLLLLLLLLIYSLRIPPPLSFIWWFFTEV